VHGYSQGAQVAQLAATKSDRVTAALLFSMSARNCMMIPLCPFPASSFFMNMACLRNSEISRFLPKSKRRYVIGSDDWVFNHPDDRIDSQRQVSGVSCGRCDSSHPISTFPFSSCRQDGSLNCLQADGSGHYIVGSKNHWWFQNSGTGVLYDDFVRTKQPW
jgi:hypothetical protein